MADDFVTYRLRLLDERKVLIPQRDAFEFDEMLKKASVESIYHSNFLTDNDDFPYAMFDISPDDKSEMLIHVMKIMIKNGIVDLGPE
ncbi:hypothetical protein Pla110_44170 [Polystyrenella longa]|uniref:Uncharacterized protein n=1 Tax=Polystyrenella longa TaxID=2528007 RepID=A0A518CTU4_9PLAN|nr:hypothetical protein [Polystyrenella longa]QDU82656.1 hypothetical protein Pla110_44170 [Polystyrenella longa]